MEELIRELIEKNEDLRISNYKLKTDKNIILYKIDRKINELQNTNNTIINLKLTDDFNKKQFVENTNIIKILKEIKNYEL